MSARILIIEDDDASRALVHYLLTSSGYIVIEASDGASGLAKALTADPDLILCDLQLPNIDGYQLIERLRADSAWKNVPIVAVSAFSMPGDRERCQAAGFNEHISKPIDPQSFVSEVARFLPISLRGMKPWSENEFEQSSG